jgi:O-antigen/teichoic acid export membrane protein
LNNKTDSYRQILKANSIFGGVQLFSIIITIVRSKVVAILLGPLGMGVSGLLLNTTGMIQSLTNFGLSTSAVKDIAQANESKNNARIAIVVQVLKRLVYFTGLTGMLLTFILAPILSDLTFGNDEYSIAFRWLSVTLLFNQLASGQNVLLQGTRKLAYLAKSNMLGSFLGLFISLPLYFFYGIDGIVPAIIGTSLLTFCISFYFASKINFERPHITFSETKKEGKAMLKLGFVLSLSGLMTSIAAYIVSIYISSKGGVEEVGLYNAGFTIVGTYVGLVFTAMITDYYPRLSGIVSCSKKSISLINQQSIIAILILGPILVFFIVFIKYIVIVLLTEKFISVISFVHWAALGVYFKAISWALAIYILAKGVAKLYFINALIFNIYMLVFNIIGYYFGGLSGLGITFLVGYGLYSFQVFLIVKIKYGFKFSREFTKIFSIQLMFGISCFLTITFLPQPYAYCIGCVLIIITSWFSIKELDQKLGIREILLKKYNIKL